MMARQIARWVVVSALLIAASAATHYAYTYYQSTKPCATPIAYTLGTVDPRFQLSPSGVLTQAERAAAIWSTAAGKELFRYEPTAALSINFIYDEREATARLSLDIAAEQERQELTRKRLDHEQIRYSEAQAAYNARVEAINARGGARKEEVPLLAEARRELEAAAASINAQVASFNADVARLNALIEQFNSVAGRTYEEGQYVYDSSGERVNIFVYLNDEQLARVLAHEFGHALGLDHNDDPSAIMYAKNESGNLDPSGADLEALAALCSA